MPAVGCLTEKTWVIRSVAAINNCGEIIGVGYEQNVGAHGFLLRPIKGL